MKRSAILCLALCLVFQVSSAAAATMYNLTRLGAFGSYPASGSTASSYAYAVNDLGHVAGKANSGQGTRAFIWKADGMTSLGTLMAGEGFSYAYGINDSDVVVGTSVSPMRPPGTSGNQEAFRWESGTMTGLGWIVLEFPGCNESVSFGINNLGLIAGYTGAAPFNSCGVNPANIDAFLYDGSMSALSGIPSGASGARAINQNGAVSGDDWTNGAFVWTSGGGPVWLGYLGSNSGGTSRSYAYGINDMTDVVGTSITTNYEAYIWSATGGMQALGDIPGGSYSSIAYGINNARQVVGAGNFGGRGLPPAADQQAFLWDSVNGMVSLNALVLNAPGWRLLEAWDINNSGQIVGWGINPSGGTEAFLLTPAPLESPTIGFSPESFAFSVKAGGTGTQSLVITNTGNGNMAWTTSRNQNWISILPPSGMVASGAYNYADVTVNAAGLAEGIYTGNISVKSPGATNTPVVVPVSMTIQPQIVITYPNGGETLRSGQNVTITWNVNTLQAVAKTDTSYSLNGGTTWNLIKSQRGLASSCPWRVPSLKAASNNCLVKVEFKNAAGAVIGQDRSNAVFTITK